MEDQRRLFLAIALSLLVVTAWRYLVTPPSVSPLTTEKPVTQETTVGPKGPPPEQTAATAPPAPPITTVPPESDERERRIELSNSDLTAAFTNRGGRLISWRLEKFRDRNGRQEEMVMAGASGLRPFDVETGDPELDGRLKDALFRSSAESVTADENGAVVSFRFAQDDVVVEKTVRIEAHGYLLHASVQVHRGGRAIPVRLLWGPGLGNPTVEEKAVQGYQAPQTVALVGRDVERIAAQKLKNPRVLESVSWVGVEAQYFAVLIVPPDNGGGQLRTFTLPGANPVVMATVAADLGRDGSPATVYVGPKDFGSLSKLGHNFARVVPIGDWIGPIVVLIMHFLGWIHGRVGNYGWSIVVLTILINLALAPLRHYGIANGVKMAKLAPEMKVIQDRYRGIPALDKRREQMQREISVLYAKHGMNMGTQMAMGCLPLLLTFPFLIAIYRVLQVSVELRGAPFLWIPDLSHKDPLFLTPILMGASMLLMQKMTPSAMDASQQRMMMIMPVVFMVMFFAAPAGLNLYWLASNVCSLVQQGLTLSFLQKADPAGRGERRRL